ncbi:imidazolonepropionase [Aliidiomarina sedimenti]|uniref:Imidazolonepropionase n=1 Tax=Aliidiomarina sedimenti TaxID=1933879 RepID=A0ABY0BXJ1_9GAMM|nr:imidazolonepropionase [Aliidiomarina sedimenti]RUO29200.1 imidazolonepropionase [Aliidiomarina sedimenti]
MPRTVIHNVTLATMQQGADRSAGFGLVENGALVIEGEQILWCGPQDELPQQPEDATNVDGHGGVLSPGLIDCHTHLVWAGSRANEFSMRLHGASYEEIANAGGGILSTVRATRAASEDELYQLAAVRAAALIDQGVTELEIKSGYGLDTETELKQLRVARRLGATLPINVHTTFLAAHALPEEYKDNSDGYIEYICEQMLPQAVAEGLVDAVDVFCERIGFSRAQTERVFKAAQGFNLPVKLHAEQLSDQDGAALVADYQGLSADHLEYLSEQGIAAMKQAGTVAVLLPGAFYFLRETKYPPIDALRAAGVPIAIATDANPGSSPIHNAQLMLHMASTIFRLTPEEALAGMTCHAAKALGQNESGVLQAGKQANLVLWNVAEPAELCYQFGVNPLRQRWFKGRAVHDQTSTPG